MAAEERHTETEGRIRAAMAQLLGGDIPEGLKCDVKSLCTLSGVPRATLYRSYPHVKAEFERARSDAQTAGHQPDPRLASSDRATQNRDHRPAQEIEPRKRRTR